MGEIPSSTWWRITMDESSMTVGLLPNQVHCEMLINQTRYKKMANIEINADLWDSLSAPDKEEIENNLKKNRLLLDGGVIVGNPAIPSPPGTAENWIDDLKRPACQLACDAAAAAAIASLTLTGPALAVAVVAIEAARQACRNSC